ncbi:MAG: aldo/keto reductase [Methanosarcinaceae archaeon]
MKQKHLGNHGPQVAVIGQGTMGVGGYFSKDDSKDDYFVEVIKYGLERGLSFIDTAEAYGVNHSEELVGIAVKDCRNDVFIATKVSPEHLSYNDVLKSAEGSLRRLKTNYVDLYQIHWPNPFIPLEDTMAAMQKLVEDGKVRYIGVSNFSQKQLSSALKCFKEIVSVQVEYNLFDRTIEENLLPYCERKGVSIIAYSPLDQGKFLDDSEKLRILKEIALKYERTEAQVILNWLVSKTPVFAIPKSGNVEHIKDNSASSDFNLELEDIKRIDSTFKQPSISIPIDQINSDKEGLDKFVPGPEILAEEIKGGEDIKPIRVVPSKDKPGTYDLVEGKLRFWAWVMAYDGNHPVQALLR